MTIDQQWMSELLGNHPEPERCEHIVLDAEGRIYQCHRPQDRALSNRECDGEHAVAGEPIGYRSELSPAQQRLQLIALRANARRMVRLNELHLPGEWPWWARFMNWVTRDPNPGTFCTPCRTSWPCATSKITSPVWVEN